jgi:hypothetical protein
VRPVGFTVIVRGVPVFAPAGLTESQVPPSVVVTLVENETAASAAEGVVVKVTVFVKEVVEPI